MKSFIIAVIIFMSIVGLGVYSYHYLDQTSKELAHHTDLLARSIREKDWEQVDKDFASLKSSWNKVNTKWPMLIDHQELDAINISLSRIREYVHIRHLPGLSAEVAELKLLLLHIPKKEAPTLENVF